VFKGKHCFQDRVVVFVVKEERNRHTVVGTRNCAYRKRLLQNVKAGDQEFWMRIL